MKVQFEAKAYLSKYGSLKSIMDGKEMPVIDTGDGSYFTSRGYPLIGTATVTIELHSNDQIVSNQLAALQAQLHTVRAENQQRENAILDQISKLQAITFRDIPAEARAAAEAHDRSGLPDGEVNLPKDPAFCQHFWAALQDLRGEASA